jgi:hypothetical protein
MPDTYATDRISVKADIEAAGATGYILERDTNRRWPCSFLILGYTAFERLGGTVLDRDAKFMTPGLGIPTIDPEQHDAVVNDPRPAYAASVGTYQIVDPAPFMPGGIPIYYDLQVRKR